jgi:hypothetical protein
MKYTLIPAESHIDELIVEVSSVERLMQEVETFCKATGADRFSLDIISEEDERGEYGMDRALDWMR